ncbi:MAG: CPBP family intramembrane metalloprotease [Sulfobacillus thermotolerans]|uniref:CAAX prenyl protease 2/Lysostaphin resistance protein A-like domain-containing protein n=1 Tax=Sulfobacillus thermotolerans TaxID=338644 RepID=A0ABN5GXY8_9FIRM|nr:hypothetical protein BXT84_05065 [Sulfobacillus thermotolerans]MCY0906964.1 CPBP family intramembrane metalloprotease [Sulfobacillus thermotolerans]
MTVMACFGGSIVAFLMVWGLLRLSNQVIQHPVRDPVAFPRQLRLGMWLLVMALFEEGLFRWLLVGVASRFIGLGPAFIVSVAAFTVAHRTNGTLSYSAVINLILVSTILGAIFIWWGFWAAVAAHFGWNLAQWWLGFTVSGEKTRPLLPSPHMRTIPDCPYGPESHWTTTIVMIATLIAMIAPGLGHLTLSRGLL